MILIHHTGKVTMATNLLHSLPASSKFCCLLITFANSLDPDQARENVGPDLDPSCLTLNDDIPLRIF